MKKCILILALILIAQPGYKIVPALAEEAESAPASSVSQEKSSPEIKSVIETYLNCVVQQDINGALGNVSREFSAVVEDRTLDYDGLKFYLESRIKNTTHGAFSNLKVVETNVAGNRANILVEYTVTGFNLVKNADFEKLRRIRYSLVKEGDIWKIVSMEPS